MTCRNSAAKEFIEEAVICYEGGAIRSSIVATWTAVFFDLLDKARELGVGGDAQAQALVDRFEKAEANSDVGALLKIERDILDAVRRELQLFSDFEFRDIRRIQEDRHRCAHPTLDGDGNRFVPSPELARAHIVNAITILLQQPPVQGKAAIADIVALVSSKLFPSERKKAIVALRQTGLGRPRNSLLRNLVVIFLKSYLRPDGSTRHYQFSVALKAVLEMHRKDVLVILESELSRVIRSMNDDQLTNALTLISMIDELISFVDADQLNRLKRFVSTMSGKQLMYIDNALDVEALNGVASLRVNRMELEEISDVFFFALPVQVANRLIELLRQSKSFDDSNAICEELRKSLRDFSDDQLSTILSIGGENAQVAFAFDYKNLSTEIETQLGKD